MNKQELNILICSAGRRVSLVKIFKKTLDTHKDVFGKVYTCDLNPSLSAACHISDGYIKVPRVTHKEYLDILKTFCKQNNISIIIPTIDTELVVLSEAKEEFLKENIQIIISSKEICEIFYLKTSTEQFFVDNGFDTPKTINNLITCKYPIFAKLNNSSSSIGAQIVYDQKIAIELSKSNNYIFQEYICAEEFTVDVFMDKNENIISAIPRKRLEVRAGEVSKALAIKNKKILEEIQKLCKKLKGAYGCITIQIFVTDERITFIEINPRFGGGYPLSYFAGANFAQYIIDEFLGKNLEFDDSWIDKTLMLRYDSEVILDGSSL
ncbi:MAG: ATP-grasp domain-containing protein [Campylobacteraceae bacterium]